MSCSYWFIPTFKWWVFVSTCLDNFVLIWFLLLPQRCTCYFVLWSIKDNLFLYKYLLFSFCQQWHKTYHNMNCISGIMVSVLISCVVDRGFEPRLGKTKDYKIGICCFSAKHTALRRKSKDWLAQNQDNVSIRGLLFQWASTIKS